MEIPESPTSNLRPSKSYKDSEKLEHLASFFNAKYHFRTAIRDGGKNPSTWLDQDQSGDYDPDRKSARPKKKRDRANLSGDESLDPTPKKAKSELILPPAKKRACERCNSRRIVCSHREGGDRSVPCQQCADGNLECVAGRESGRTRTGPSLDQDLSCGTRFIPTPQRRFVACTQCRRAKKWCSLKARSHDMPCKHCRESGDNCTFEALSTKNKEMDEECGDKSQETLQDSASIPSIQNPTTKHIITRLAHPIEFNYEQRDKEDTCCHWCQDPAYGLLGLGEVRVQVVDCHDGNGYIEVDGGHTGNGTENSNMCVQCTFDRFIITACQAHDIQPIPGMNPDTFDFTEITEYMTPGLSSKPPWDWCSICPAPAFFACCVPRPPEFEMMDEISGREVVGCGLFLCENCAVALVDEHAGVLEGLIDTLEVDKDNGGFGLRADADFLHAEGEMMRQTYAKRSG
ncbi:hypothetical protein MMC12_005808 [Toensbergia leucococca]|nr:hypothetical protein [Toensbergia leucococca]